jgi:hypothetical protein
VVAVDELFAGVGSAIADETVAVFDTVEPLAGVVAIKAMLAEPPTFTVPNEQVTVAPPEQEPCEGVAETKAIPLGRTSVTTTLEAKLGPAFETVIV